LSTQPHWLIHTNRVDESAKQIGGEDSLTQRIQMSDAKMQEKVKEEMTLAEAQCTQHGVKNKQNTSS